MQEHTNNIITHLHKYTNRQYISYSKSFNEFWNDRIFNTSEDIFFIFGEKFIVLQNARPHLLPPIINHQIDHINLRIFHQLSKKYFDLENLLALSFWKGKTATEIKTTNKEKTHLYEFTSYYKETKRSYKTINAEDFTHMITITFPHPTFIKHPIFTMNYNEILRSFINQGLQRQRVYIEKKYEDKLKRVISDPQKRRETAKKLKKENFQYSKTYEIHENGFLHVHFLMKLPPFLRSRNFKELINLFAKWYNTKPIGVDIKYLKKKNRKRASNYVNKYLRKQYQEPALKYTIDPDGIMYYLIDKKRFYLNDIPRIQSYSRNCKKNEIKIYKAQKCISVRELGDNEEDKTIKEYPYTYIKAERISTKIDFIDYLRVKEDIDRFKRLKAKREAHRQIKQWEERNKTLETLRDYINGKINIIDSVLLYNRDDEFKKVLNALEKWKKEDKEIKKHYENLIIEADKKLKKDLFIIDVTPPPPPTPEKLQIQRQEEPDD